MNTKNIVIGGLAVLLVVFAILFFKGDANTPVSNTPDGEEVVGGNVEFSKKSFTQGFFAGDGRELEVTNQGVFTQANVSSNSRQASIVSTTTVNTALARIQNPFSATSTYSNFACGITTSTSTATVIALYEAETESDSYGTSTNGTALASVSIAASALGSVLSGTNDNENILGPSKWLVAGYDSGTNGAPGDLVNMGQAGKCSVVFREI